VIKLGSSNVLGIAIADRTIMCAELALRGDRRSVRKTATFTLPEELSLEKPDAVGQALAVFLRSNGFSASRAVVGVPAKWLIASEKEVPPASLEQMRGILRLTAERLAVAESGELVFDYAGDDAAKTGKVLLVAMLRKQYERVEQAIEAAGLTIIAITPTSLAVATAASPDDRNAPMLMVSQGGAEFVVQTNGTPRMLRHVSLSQFNGHGPPLTTLGAELRRTVAMGTAASELVLWDSVGLSETQIGELSERSGLKVRAGTVPNSPEKFAQPVALAMAGADRSLLPLDFSHSRLAPRVKRRFGRRGVWAGAIGGVLLIGIVALYFDVHHLQSNLDQMNSTLTKQEPTVKSAENMIDRLNYSRGYFAARPALLEALREATLAFRDDDQIWATSFSVKDTGKVQLMGKANDESTVLALADRMRKNSKLSDVKVLDVSESAARSRDRSFSISFTFNQ
jgi:hypothetical protein